MNHRTRNLLILFCILLLSLLGIICYTQYQSRMAKLERELMSKQLELTKREQMIEMVMGYKEELLFFKKFEPSPKSAQQVQTELFDFCKSKIRIAGLEEPRSPKLQQELVGTHYNRMRIELVVRGLERSVLSLLAELSNPEEYRSISGLKMEPKAGDESNTLVDAVILVDQWFVPSKGVEEMPENESEMPH